jgi:hypothetical protein
MFFTLRKTFFYYIIIASSCSSCLLLPDNKMMRFHILLKYKDTAQHKLLIINAQQQKVNSIIL